MKDSMIILLIALLVGFSGGLFVGLKSQASKIGDLERQIGAYSVDLEGARESIAEQNRAIEGQKLGDIDPSNDEDIQSLKAMKERLKKYEK